VPPLAPTRQELRQTLQEEDLHTFGELAHSLKSGVCMIGCDRLALLCSKIGERPLAHPAGQRLNVTHTLRDVGNAEKFGREGDCQDGEALVWCFDTYMNDLLQEAMEELAQHL